MRLEPEEIAAIKGAARYAFGDGAVVRLFGSRADDTRRGGDIDLHVEAFPGINEFEARCRFEEHLFARLEEQRVDLVVQPRGRPPAAIDLIARRDGIVL